MCANSTPARPAASHTIAHSRKNKYSGLQSVQRCPLVIEKSFWKTPNALQCYYPKKSDFRKCLDVRMFSVHATEPILTKFTPKFILCIKSNVEQFSKTTTIYLLKNQYCSNGFDKICIKTVGEVLCN